MNDDLFDEMFYKMTMESDRVMCQDCFGDGFCINCGGEGEIDGERCVSCNGNAECPFCEGEGKVKREQSQ